MKEATYASQIHFPRVLLKRATLIRKLDNNFQDQEQNSLLCFSGVWAKPWSTLDSKQKTLDSKKTKNTFIKLQNNSQFNVRYLEAVKKNLGPQAEKNNCSENLWKMTEFLPDVTFYSDHSPIFHCFSTTHRIFLDIVISAKTVDFPPSKV